MSGEELARRKRVYLGSYLGLLLGWIGLLIIGAAVALALRELHLYKATSYQLCYWAAVVVGATAALYAIIMFAVTWSYARALEVHFLPSLAFAIWGAMPVCNIFPLILLVILSTRRIQRTEAGEAQ